jgi:fermentation-respiration switch protein FrsA (DUF1100 family)
LPPKPQQGFLVLGRSRRWNWRRILLVVAGLYVIACLGLRLFERQITYQPNATRTTPAAARLPQVKEQTLRTPDGQRLIVWRLPAQPGRPTILYFHGNGDPLTYRSGRVGSFEAEGYGLYMIAYRGFSGSTGAPTEAAIISDALLAYGALRSEGVAAEDIIIYGESLGTNVALRTALSRPAAALILEAPFTSMVDAWRQFVPLMPVGLLLRDRFDSIGIIDRLKMPLLVMHGERDRLVGFRLGQRLFKAAPEPKRFESFPEAGHMNLYDYNAIAAVRRFIADVRAGRLGR